MYKLYRAYSYIGLRTQWTDNCKHTGTCAHIAFAIGHYKSDKYS